MFNENLLTFIYSDWQFNCRLDVMKGFIAHNGKKSAREGNM